MHYHQFYVGCLAHASYLIGDGGEAAVVDPARDIEMYLEEAAAHGLSIRWVLETHLHADFVSGHRELAARTGATIAIGARAGAAFPHRALADGDEIRLGEVVIRALETPGHTPESLSFLVFERASDPQPRAVLTGDTLFVGDVGRVDILSSRLPVAELAGLMYDSLHTKLLTLPAAEWAAGHVPGALLVPLDGQYASWVGTLVQPDQPLVVLADPAREEEALMRLARVGYESIAGTLAGGIERWRAEGRPVASAANVPITEAVGSGRRVLDVRRRPEWEAFHIEGATHVPLAQLAARSGELDPGADWAVVCASG